MQKTPIAVMNYRTKKGWEQAEITAENEIAIQHEARTKNVGIVAECLLDAKGILEGAKTPVIATPENVLRLALFLAERRIIHISRTYDEFLKAKVTEARETDDVRYEAEEAV